MDVATLGASKSYTDEQISKVQKGEVSDGRINEALEKNSTFNTVKESTATNSEDIKKVAELTTEEITEERSTDVDWVVESGKYPRSASVGSTVSLNSADNRTAYIVDVNEGEVYDFQFSVGGNEYCQGYIIADSNNRSLEIYYLSTGGWHIENKRMTMPSNAKKLYITQLITNEVYCRKIEDVTFTRAKAYDRAETDDIIESITHKPCILLNFDAPSALFSDGRHELCMKYGIPYTANVTIETDGSVAYPDKQFGINRIKDMLKCGVDFALYSKNFPSDYSDSLYNDMSKVSEWEEYVQQAIDKAEELGIYNPTCWFARFMKTGVALNQALINKGIRMCRGYKVGTPESYTFMGWEDKDVSRVNKDNFNVMGTGVNNNITTEEYQQRILEAINNGKNIWVFGHGIINDESSSTYNDNMTTARFEEVLTFIRQLVDEGKAEVSTFRDYYHYIDKTDALMMDNARLHKEFMS